MKKYIALFRGINVGGHHKLPMKELKALMEDQTLSEVQTYIQSGNVVFSSNLSPAKLTSLLQEQIQETFGFTPNIFILEAKALKQSIANNSFPTDNGKLLHFYFLESKPDNASITKLAEIKKGKEDFAIKDKVLYLYTPDGYGKSKLASSVESKLKIKATARNWNTISKLAELAELAGI